jgi:pimeloyl-ACP methyl ester carboxylesterase
MKRMVIKVSRVLFLFQGGISGQLIHWPPNMIQGLVDHGYYIVTFDNRDSGLSHYYDDLGSPNINELIEVNQRGEAVTVPYTLEDMAADVIALMDHLEIVHKMGHGIPDRLGDQLVKLIVVFLGQ